MPFIGILEIILLPAPALPWMISVVGGVVGECALVTQMPIGTPFTLLPPFFFRMILRCVGFWMFKKYCGFLHQNWFSLPFSSTLRPPAVLVLHLPWNCYSMVLGSWTRSMGSLLKTLRKNGLSSSFLLAVASVLGMIM